MDRSEQLAEIICSAAEARSPLRIQGGGSKAFYGRPVEAEPVETTSHTGIVSYEPTERVLTARCGTPLAEIESALAHERQMLGFEPPQFAGGATLGGAVATALGGPRRMAAGGIRDAVQGVRVINGRGEHLRFGGDVMKNVAGFDVSRLMAGALGTLGLITEVSLRVSPVPEMERTHMLELDPAAAQVLLDDWLAAGLPVSGWAHDGERCYVRLSGTSGAVASASSVIGGEELADGEEVWRALRDHRLAFFQSEGPLWRIALPAHAPELDLPCKVFSECGHRLRWLKTRASAADVRRAVQAVDGHATLFRGAQLGEEVFPPLPLGVDTLHRNLKHAFDPLGILNPGRMYATF